MFSLRSPFLLRLMSVSVLLLLPLIQGIAQEDPDPNSPTPVILSQADSTRALTALPGKSQRTRLSAASAQAFQPGAKVRIFVTNLDLMNDEGANAFRLYAEDAKGRQYRFPIHGFSEVTDIKGVYAVTFSLTDEVGYWEQPSPNGDLLLGITWRGLASNRVRLGFGRTGGEIKDDAGAVPTPLSALALLNKNSGGETPPAADLVGYRWSGDRMRFLQQTTFGPTQALDWRVRRIGLRIWLVEQLEMAYPSLANPYPNIPLKSTDSTVAPPIGCGLQPVPNTPEYRMCIRDHYSMYPVQTWFFKEAFYGEPQLRHRVSWALSQIWVISGAGGDTQQSSHMIAYHQMLSKSAFGSYRTLMKDMTLNPGMGNYLDMIRSTRTNPNENYPREILQLFTIGLYMLNQDGTVQTDGQGIPIPTYDQNTVNNFTKVFTGWRDCRILSATCPSLVAGTVNYKDPMELVPNNHDLTAKTLLSYPGVQNPNIAACTGCNAAAITTYANNSLEQTLDNIYNHPNVGPFVSRQMIQHLVTSDPTPAYVGRIAAVFNNNGFSVRGDMKAVVKAILLDPEARGDVKTDPNYGKLREPVQLVTNVLKTFDVKSANLAQQSDGAVQNLPANMSQNPFLAPTVFNYYSPGYVVPGTTLNGPEFGIMTTSTSISRANFANTMVFGQINVGENTPAGTRIDLAEMQALAAADPTGNQLLDVLNQRMMNGNMSADMRAKILPAFTAVASTDPLGRARAAIYLVATSSQYQIQR